MKLQPGVRPFPVLEGKTPCHTPVVGIFSGNYRPLPVSRLPSEDTRAGYMWFYSERGNALVHEVTAHTAVHARRQYAVVVVQLAVVAVVAARAYTAVRERALSLEARACANENA